MRLVNHFHSLKVGMGCLLVLVALYQLESHFFKVPVSQELFQSNNDGMEQILLAALEHQKVSDLKSARLPIS